MKSFQIQGTPLCNLDLPLQIVKRVDTHENTKMKCETDEKVDIRE